MCRGGIGRRGRPVADINKMVRVGIIEKCGAGVLLGGYALP